MWKDNPETIIQYVADRIQSALSSELRPLHLCFFKDKLDVRFAGHTHEVHPVFFKFTELHNTAGLTSRQWTRIGCEVANFYNEESKCQKHQKP